MSGGYRKAADLPAIIPVFPLDGALLLPGGVLPLNIFEPRYLNMIDDALAGERIIGMIQTIPGGPKDRPHLAEVGCAGRLTAFSETGDGRYLVSLTGLCRFRIERELLAQTPYRQVQPAFAPYEPDLAAGEAADDEDGFDRVRFLSSLKTYLDRRGMEIDWDGADEAPCGALVNSLAMALPFEPAEKQALLEAPDADTRRAALVALLEIDAAESGDEPTQMQ
ncbi:MAG: peptidase S16 [Brevundimonas sp.]|nr:MAG: peptidase S16 [Brevundimonas sp.]